MPFKKGPAAWRRSLDYLSKGSLVFRDKVKICTVNYNETGPESDGLRNFVFWNFAQIQYKNPHVQCVQLKNITDTPFITFHTLDDKDKIKTINVNCYQRSHTEILEYCKKLVGKTAEEIEKAAQINVANFGEGCSRYCICLVQGQVACPRWKPLPEFMRGKYIVYKKEELEQIQKTKSDDEALKEYWERA